MVAVVPETRALYRDGLMRCARDMDDLRRAEYPEEIPDGDSEAGPRERHIRNIITEYQSKGEVISSYYSASFQDAIVHSPYFTLMSSIIYFLSSPEPRVFSTVPPIGPSSLNIFPRRPSFPKGPPIFSAVPPRVPLAVCHS